MKDSNDYMKVVNRITKSIKKYDKLIKQYFEKEHDKTCCACLDDIADQQMSCIHKICEHCYSTLYKCPLCRTFYKTRITYYHVINSIRINTHDRPFRHIFEEEIETNKATALHYYEYFLKKVN